MYNDGGFDRHHPTLKMFDLNKTSYFLPFSKSDTYKPFGNKIHFFPTFFVHDLDSDCDCCSGFMVHNDDALHPHDPERKFSKNIFFLFNIANDILQ